MFLFLWQADFDAEMDELKFLNSAAHSYLSSIPAKHWSRHAFSTHCKSNMLLNNMCETFNNVIKEARDKPILTHMEWMRKYVMKRRCQKRDGVKCLEGNWMPYVHKCLNSADDQSRFCTLTQSSDDVYEVDYRGDTYVVNLREKTCSCFHWNLTGLPCPHAMSCIVDKRAELEPFIHEAYSKVKYTLAFANSVSPMPSVKHWSKVSQEIEPLPPPFKKLPGRPNLKKRKKEAGEGTSKQVTRPRAPRKCAKCGVHGHTIKTCKNGQATKSTSTTSALKPLKTSSWTRKRNEAVARRKAQKSRVAEVSSMMASTSAVSQEHSVYQPVQSAPPRSLNTRSQATRHNVNHVQDSQASATRGVDL